LQTGSIALALMALGMLWASTVQAARLPSQPSAARALRPGIERTTMRLEASYELRTHLHYDAARIEVTETVTIVNRAAREIDALQLSVLARAYGEFRLRWVRIDGQSARVRWPDRASMLVAMPRPLAPDEQTTLTIRFSDHPTGDVRTSLRSRLSKAEGMMRVADWFPILSTGHGLHDPGDSQVSAAATSITLDLTTDRTLAVAAPGRLIEQHGRHRVHRLLDARDYAFVVAPHLRRLSATTRDGVRIRLFYPAAVSTQTARGTLREARRALQRFAEAYGPYPWPELVIAPTPGGWIATEWPSLVFLGSDTYGDAAVVHHEVAHQWFYALVGSDQLREPWVDEAFAEFSQRHFFGGRDWSYCSRKRVDSPVYAFPGPSARWGCHGYAETVYAKGAAMIDGVRARMGDRAFFATMRGFIADHRFELVSGNDLVEAWLSESPDPNAVRRWLGRFLGRRSMAA
jgi:aminopeptidase N